MGDAVSFLGAIEIVDRGGHVQSRARVERTPFRIGRALDNDLVLDDPYVCAHHAEIRGVDVLELVDLASVNGSFAGGARERQPRIALGEGAELRIGHTLLRFRGAGETLPAALLDPLAGSRWLQLDRLRWAALAVIGYLLVAIVNTVVGSASALRVGVVAGSAAPSLIVIAIWALAWSLVNRVVAHRFHYLGHLAIGSFGIIAASLTETIGGYTSFALAADSALPAIVSLTGALLISVVIFGHLRLLSRGSGRRLLLPAGLVGAAFLALVLLPDAGDGQFNSEPKFDTALKPPVAALRAGRSSEAYYTEALEALDAADAAVTDAATQSE